MCWRYHPSRRGIRGPGRGLDPVRAPLAHSGGFGMLAGNDRGRRARDLLVHNEIEVDARERLVEASLMDLTCVGDALDAWDQLVAGAEGEIVVQILVARDINLGRELAVAGSGDEEVHVRRPVAMAAQPLQQLLGLAAGRTSVAARHDRTEPVAAVLVGLDPAWRLYAACVGSKCE